MTLYIISQVLYALGISIEAVSKAMKRQRLIILLMTIASIFYVGSYLCLQSPMGAVANGLTLVRGIIYIFLAKRNKPYKDYLIPIFCILTALSVAVWYFWTGPLDLFLFFGVCFSTIALAFRNTLYLRILLICSASLWAVYNCIITAYVNMTFDIVSIIIVLVAMIVYDIKPKLHIETSQTQLQANLIVKEKETED